MPVNFSSSYTQRQYYYTDWKNAHASRGGVPQSDSSDGVYQKVWFYDGPEIHYCQMWMDGYAVTDPNYSQAQNDADLADYNANMASQCNLAIEQKLSDGRIRVSSEKTNQSRITIYSPNWCDKTTWYQSSTYVNETPSLNEDGYYHLAHQYIIDSYHGKITMEDSLKDSAGYTYRVGVNVDGYNKVEQDPHYGTGGDYLIDYANGIIIPLSWTQSGGDTVIITYHYATLASFTILPAAGKQLLVNMAECQFSTDVVMNDTVTFQVYGYAGVFAPQLGYPFTTLIPLTNFKYKSMNDLYNDACKSYPVYPPMGGAGWRGLNVGSTVLDWDYVSSTTVNSAFGMSIVVSLDHNEPFGGTYATVTFYCTVE